MNLGAEVLARPRARGLREATAGRPLCSPDAVAPVPVAALQKVATEADGDGTAEEATGGASSYRLCGGEGPGG